MLKALRRILQPTRVRTGTTRATHADAQSVPPVAADALPASKFDYRTLALTRAQIETDAFKSHLGGGAAQWDRRGAFQLALLQHYGLTRSSRLLDVGCGPLRGGVHFLDFLAPGRYRGVDFNASLIDAAHAIMDRHGHGDAKSRVSVLTDFGLSCLGETYDFVLCFSVLNHCSVSERLRFFAEIAPVMAPAGCLIVTHGGWFDPGSYPLAARFSASALRTPDELPPALALSSWGFDDAHSSPLPILVFRRDMRAPSREAATQMPDE